MLHSAPIHNKYPLRMDEWMNEWMKKETYYKSLYFGGFKFIRWSRGEDTKIRRRMYFALRERNITYSVLPRYFPGKLKLFVAISISFWLIFAILGEYSWKKQPKITTVILLLNYRLFSILHLATQWNRNTSRNELTSRSPHHQDSTWEQSWKCKWSVVALPTCLNSWESPIYLYEK